MKLKGKQGSLAMLNKGEQAGMVFKLLHPMYAPNGTIVWKIDPPFKASFNGREVLVDAVQDGAFTMFEESIDD